MKNGRHSNNDPKRRDSATSPSVGQNGGDGDNIRTNDRNKSSIDGGIAGSEIESKSIDGTEPNASRGNSQLKLADGFYFTPDGTVARIPDGYYLKSDGRLAKRRERRNSDNSSDGNENRDRTETSEQPEYDTEIPIRTVGRKKQKKITEHQQRLTMVAMLSVACSATFTSIALLTKHHHWSLESEEVKPLAEALNEAFATLPTKAYETIIALIEKWVPWVNLIFILSAIIIPRIEESVKRVEETRFKPNPRANSGDGGAKDNPFPYESSFGFNE